MDKEIINLLKQKNLTIEEALNTLDDCKSFITPNLPCTAFFQHEVPSVSAEGDEKEKIEELEAIIKELEAVITGTKISPELLLIKAYIVLSNQIDVNQDEPELVRENAMVMMELIKVIRQLDSI